MQLTLEPLEVRILLATFGVNTFADTVDINPGDGLAVDASGNTSLRAAIMEANALAGDDIIDFPAGTYTFSIASTDEDAAADGDLDVTSDITIVGNGANNTIIEAATAPIAADDRVFHVLSGATLNISGVTVRHGNTGGIGGGVRNEGTMTVTGSAVERNTASFAGGLDNRGTMTVNDSVVSHNTGFSGVGGINNAGVLTFSNSTISNNESNLSVGGLFSSGPTLTVTNSTISLNQADADNNFPASRGGGIYVSAGSVETINNTIVAGNSRAGGSIPSDIEGPGLIDTANHNLIGDGATSGGIVDGTNDNIVGDGAGGPLSTNTIITTALSDNGGPTQTHALVAGSAAVDAGNNTFATNAGLTTDQRGAPFDRVFGGMVDIGAFEQQALSLVGTGDDDVIVVDFNPTNFVVNINGASTTLNPTAYSAVNINALAGDDSVTINGGAGNEVAVLNKANVIVTSGGFSVTANSVETIRVNAGTGLDTATLRDSAGNDFFVATPGLVRLSGTGFINTAAGFDRMEGRAVVGNAGGAGDKALLIDSAGNDIFVSSPATSQMVGLDFNNFATGFDRVEGRATEGDMGSGGDKAFLFDSSGNDTFLATPDKGQLLGSGFNNIAIEFDRVEARVTSSNAGGVGDRALFFDSPGNDIFVATPTSGQFVGTGFNNIATDFDRVEARAVMGNMGGAGDRATLFDSSGNDVFVATPAFGRMTGSSFTNIATSFDFVEAKATAGDAGGIGDRAILNDSAGNDTFLGLNASSRLFGTGFLNIATGFDRVQGKATAGDAEGVGDVAILHDSDGDDLFFGRNDNGVLSGVGFSNDVTGFDQITANAFNGGNDTINNASLTYTFIQQGTWENTV